MQDTDSFVPLDKVRGKIGFRSRPDITGGYLNDGSLSLVFSRRFNNDTDLLFSPCHKVLLFHDPKGQRLMLTPADPSDAKATVLSPRPGFIGASQIRIGFTRLSSDFPRWAGRKALTWELDKKDNLIIKLKEN